MNKTSRGMTLGELVVVIVLVLIVAALLVPRFQGTRSSGGYRAVCKSNLEQIGRAMASYMNYSQDRLPFFEQMAPGGENHFPTDSLAMLYPEYTLNKVRIFSCPSTDDAPSVWYSTDKWWTGTGWSDLHGAKRARFGASTARAPGCIGELNESGAWEERLGPKHSSYGCDDRLKANMVVNTSRERPNGHAIAADMDAMAAIDPNWERANHRGGMNVLYHDGSVRWQTTNFCSDNPLDNIFAQNWPDADTDSFIQRP